MKRIIFVATWIVLAVSVFSPRSSALAAGAVVNNCSNDNELRQDLFSIQQTGGGTLTFNCGAATITITGQLPSILTDTTIDGGGLITLTGADQTSILNVYDTGALTLKNIQILHAMGPAVFSSGKLVVNSVNFKYNKNTYGGGGAIHSEGALTIVSGVFDANEGTKGGAIYAKRGVSITDSEFRNNKAVSTVSAAWGAALYIDQDTTASIDRSLIEKNRAADVAGAIVVNRNASLTVNRSTLQYNVAPFGGAIWIYDVGTVHVTNSTLFSNQATDPSGNGGGIWNQGILTVSGSTLAHNSAAYGGGIYNEGSANLANVTLSVNNDALGGGGFYNSRVASALLTNVTFYQNAGVRGGNLYNNGGTLTLRNTMMAHFSGYTNCFGYTGGDHNLADDDTCGFGPGRENLDLKLGALQDNGGLTETHLPQPDSPAIDSGTGTSAPTKDQRGIDRPQGGAYDVGAVEVESAPVCAAKPDEAALKKPVNKAVVPSTRPALKWTEANCARTYNLILKYSTGDKAFVKKGLTTLKYKPQLISGKSYKWFVKACNDAGCTKSDVRTFSVE